MPLRDACAKTLVGKVMQNAKASRA